MAAVRNSDPCCSATSICNHPDDQPLGLPCYFPKTARAEADILQIISWESWHSDHIIIPGSAVRAELHLLSSVCCTIDSPAECFRSCWKKRSLIFRNNNQGHKVPERFVPEPFCWGKRAVITGILCESEDLFQLHSHSSSHQPLSACLHLQRSLIKTRKAIRGLNYFDYYKVFLVEYLFNARLCFH